MACISDRLDPEDDMIGLVIYAYEGQTEWRCNGRHCKAGYIVLKRSSAVEREPEVSWHAKLYHHVFGQSPSIGNVVASGFSCRKGIWRFNSSTFNLRGDRVMALEEQAYVQRAATLWSLGHGKVYSVAELLA